jgi:hypothetical protein
MGTRSTIKIHNGGKNSDVLVTLYKQFDGYFDGLGEELKSFLEDIHLVNGFSMNEKRKIANGMGCLAAQLIVHFKQGVGGVYVTTEGDSQEYNYQIYEKDGKIICEGEGHGEHKWILNGPPIEDKPSYNEVAEFVYNSSSGETKWRKVGLVECNQDYLKGIDLEDENKFKQFRMDRIVGGNNKIKITKVD